MATSAIGSAGESGFTLLELLVALAVMVIAVGIMPIAFNHLVPGSRVVAEAEQLSDSLRNLRDVAIATGVSQSVRAAGNDGAVLAVGTDVWMPKALVRVTLEEYGSGNGVDQILFHADGSSSGGVVVLTGERAARVRVTPVLGSVSVERQ